MALRDKARSEFYEAQSRAGTLPNTPAIPDAPKSARDGFYNPMFSPRFAPDGSDVEKQDGTITTPGNDSQYAVSAKSNDSKPFTLQAPPLGRNTPKTKQNATFDAPPVPREPGSTNFSRPTTPAAATPHQPAAPGERSYDAVPVPSAYGNPAMH